MKTYTLEEAAKVPVEKLFHEACGDETVVIVKGDQQIVLWPYNPVPDNYDPKYSDEEQAVLRAFEAESMRASLATANELPRE